MNLMVDRMDPIEIRKNEYASKFYYCQLYFYSLPILRHVHIFKYFESIIIALQLKINRSKIACGNTVS